jgi:hypothetical protein
MAALSRTRRDEMMRLPNRSSQDDAIRTSLTKRENCLKLS